MDDHEILAVASFRLALRRFEQQTEKLVRGRGLTPQRYLLMLTVRSAQITEGYATVSQIARDLRMPQTTVTDLVSRAADVGLLAKDDHGEDGRVVRITVTAEGERRLESAIQSLAGERADLEAALAEAARLYA